MDYYLEPSQAQTQLSSQIVEQSSSGPCTTTFSGDYCRYVCVCMWVCVCVHSLSSCSFTISIL